jgi:GT2 family glycosyltransferase
VIVSVIVPCRNEKQYIAECVDAIFASKFSADIQLHVRIVDGRSDDGTLEIIEELQQHYPTLSVVTNEKQLTPFAFNLGIHAMKADYYQIIGARQIISSNYIDLAVKTFQNNPEIWCVGGKVENVYLNEQAEIIAKAMSTSFGMGLGNFRILEKSAFVDTVGTPMYPQEVFKKIGFFDEDLVRNQDDDFNFRVTQAGGKIYYCHEISLKYYVRGNLPNLWRQFHQYGYWKVFVNRKHKAVTTMRQLVPPAFVLFLLTIPFTFLIHRYLGYAALSGLVMYVGLGMLVALRATDKPKNVFPLWSVFPVLHLSYGLGYLKGMIDFLVLRKNPSDQAKRLSR